MNMKLTPILFSMLLALPLGFVRVAHAGPASDVSSVVAENPANGRLLLLDEALRNQLFEIALIKKSVACSRVSSSVFQRLDDQLVGYWTVVCEDTTRYSVQIVNDDQGSMSAKDCHLMTDAAVPCDSAGKGDEQSLVLLDEMKSTDREFVSERVEGAFDPTAIEGVSGVESISEEFGKSESKVSEEKGWFSRVFK